MRCAQLTFALLSAFLNVGGRAFFGIGRLFTSVLLGSCGDVVKVKLRSVKDVGRLSCAAFTNDQHTPSTSWLSRHASPQFYQRHLRFIRHLGSLYHSTLISDRLRMRPAVFD